MSTAAARVTTEPPPKKKTLLYAVIGLALLAGLAVAAWYLARAAKRRKQIKSAQILAESQREAHLAAVAQGTKEVIGRPGLVAQTGVLPSEFDADKTITGEILTGPGSDFAALPVDLGVPMPALPNGAFELEAFSKFTDYKLQTPEIIGQFTLPFDVCYRKCAENPRCLAFASSFKTHHGSENCELYGANRVTGAVLNKSSTFDLYEKPLMPC